MGNGYFAQCFVVSDFQCICQYLHLSINNHLTSKKSLTFLLYFFFFSLRYFAIVHPLSTKNWFKSFPWSTITIICISVLGFASIEYFNCNAVEYQKIISLILIVMKLELTNQDKCSN